MDDGITIRTDAYELVHSSSVKWSERAAARSFGSCRRENPLDPVGVADFLLVGHALGARTLFEDIQHTTADALIRVDKAA